MGEKGSTSKGRKKAKQREAKNWERGRGGQRGEETKIKAVTENFAKKKKE